MSGSANNEAITKDEFLTAIECIALSVFEFHERFGIPAVGATASEEEILARTRTRLSYLVEEIGEHAKDLNQSNLSEASLELADVAFVAIGTLLELDKIGTEACTNVARKNDMKTLSTHEIESGSGKLVKKNNIVN